MEIALPTSYYGGTPQSFQAGCKKKGREVELSEAECDRGAEGVRWKEMTDKPPYPKPVPVPPPPPHMSILSETVLRVR